MIQTKSTKYPEYICWGLFGNLVCIGPEALGLQLGSSFQGLRSFAQPDLRPGGIFYNRRFTASKVVKEDVKYDPDKVYKMPIK
jgi:hypothetical protein